MTEMSAAEAATVARFEAGVPAPESYRPGGDDGLRSAIVDELLAGGFVNGYGDLDTEGVADVVLALPEVAALRAKADAADRVRELHRPWRDLPICQECTDEITVGWPCPTIEALDGPPC